MTREAERVYVRRWVETGRLFEDVCWHELQALDVEWPTLADRIGEGAILVFKYCLGWR